MIKLILERLKQDSELSDLLKVTPEDNRISASFGDDFDTQIVYKNNPMASSDFIERNRLTLSVYDTEDRIIEAVDKRLKEILLIPESQKLHDNEVCITAIDYDDGSQEEWITEGGPKLLKRDLNFRIVWRYKK